MSKILENKQIIHIVSEVVILSGITFYFVSQNKKLQTQINELSGKLDEYEEMYQNHEQVIRQLVAFANTQSANTQSANTQSANTQSSNSRNNKAQTSNKLSRNHTHKSNGKSKKQKNKPLHTVTFQEPSSQQEEDNNDSDSELDKEIEQELLELNDAPKSENTPTSLD